MVPRSYLRLTSAVWIVPRTVKRLPANLDLFLTGFEVGRCLELVQKAIHQHTYGVFSSTREHLCDLSPRISALTLHVYDEFILLCWISERVEGSKVD